MADLLDTFCGAGGAAMGYSRAGFDRIVGVDLNPQPRYPFEFVQANALDYIAEHGHEFDAIHASPPCQGYSIMRNLPWLKDKEYPLLIEPVRELLEATGKSWVIENVMGAHLEAGWLCGTMFGLPFYRHRAFESNWYWMQPGHPKHQTQWWNGTHKWSDVHTFQQGERRSSGISSWQGNGAANFGVGLGHAAGWRLAAKGMGIDWMKRDELTQAIPPAYTEHIGAALLRLLEAQS